MFAVLDLKQNMHLKLVIQTEETHSPIMGKNDGAEIRGLSYEASVAATNLPSKEKKEKKRKGNMIISSRINSKQFFEIKKKVSLRLQ